MAPVAQTTPSSNDVGSYDGSRPRFQSLQAWLEIYGGAEYAVYKKDHAPSDLEYEEWATSVHAHGMYLWHAALDVWEEPSSSDEGSDLEATKLVLRGPPERKPKKPLTNGHGMRRATKTSKSTSREKSDEPTGSAKKRRKPKKKYLSQEIIAVDDSDDIEEATPVVQVANTEKPSSPPLSAAANGRRKSGGRRKKMFLSKEIVLSEDEDTDVISVDAVAVAATDAVNAFDALALEHHTPVPEVKVETPKTKSAKKPRKKHLSQEIIPLDDDDDSAPPDGVSSNTATASPESAPSSVNSRRGLRARTAAQQRPYSQDARVFEEQLLVDPETEGLTKQSPKPKPTKLAQVSYPESEPEVVDPDPEPEPEPKREREREHEYEDEDEDEEDEDEMLLDPENDTIAVEAEESSYAGRRHYKGKGRAWKKTSEDEDEDYRSPIKIKGAQPKRKLARRKSAPSENIVREDEDFEMEEESVAKEVVTEVKKEASVRDTAPKAEKQKRKPRKSHTLSEEFVRDDSDTEFGEQQEQEQKPQSEQKPVVTSPVHRILKLKMKSRDSVQSTPPKATTAVQDEDDFDTPSRKKTTPKSQPKKTRISINSRNGSPEGRGLDENGEVEQDAALLSPLRKPRKRKSTGSDEGLD